MSASPKDQQLTRRVALPIARVVLNLPDDVPRQLLTTTGNWLQLAELGATDATMLAMARSRALVSVWHGLATARLPADQARLIDTPPSIHHAVVDAVARRVASEHGHYWDGLTARGQDEYLVNARHHIDHLLQELCRHD